MASGGLSLSDLTAAIVERTQGRLRAELRGSPERRIASVAPLATAAAADLAFLAIPRYRHDARQSRAGAIVLTASDADAVGARADADGALVVVDPCVYVLLSRKPGSVTRGRRRIGFHRCDERRAFADD